MAGGPYIYDPLISSSWRIDSVYFNTEPRWVEKYSHVQQAGTLHKLIDGSAVMQVFPRDLSGRAITLELTGEEGVISADRVASLQALADLGNTVEFSDGVVTINCVFDYTRENPIDLDYIDANRVLMKGTIYLVRV